MGPKIILAALAAGFAGLAAASAAAEGTLYGVPALSREDFNRLAAEADAGLSWQAKPEGPDVLEAGSLVVAGTGSGLERYVRDGQFTEEFRRAYLRIVEARRLEAVRRELGQGRPSLIESDFRSASDADRALVSHVARAAQIIEDLYLEQKGASELKGRVPASDAASRSLFERNQGPWCEAPQTEKDPFCSALGSLPARRSGVYPEGLAQDEALCAKLRSQPDGRALLDPFTVVREKDGVFSAVPLNKAYGHKMRLVARELRRAAQAQGAGEREFVAYLHAAAQGFETNDWSAADEAWVAMNGRNSRWYLRAAPDETGFEPCEEKAGFHLAFARIDPASLAWQDRLDPLKQEMEDALAALVGPVYPARKVAFGFPDFIEVVLNAGDSRLALGAILGQSLPNWGKVASEGRRRTVAMTNLYQDPDSRRAARQKAAELLDVETMKYFTDDREPGLVGVILHEAAHNLGPHSDTRVGGKSPSEIFGGRLETVLEELKAQTAALWYVDLLRRKGLITEEKARQIYAHELAWCFGHIAQGMFTDSGQPKAYSQLSAIQVGRLVRDGALEWVGSGPVADGGAPVERFRIRFEALPGSVESLMKAAASIKAAGDVAAAKALVDDFVSGPGAALVRVPEIRARLLKYPKETFLYGVRY